MHTCLESRYAGLSRGGRRALIAVAVFVVLLAVRIGHAAEDGLSPIQNLVAQGKYSEALKRLDAYIHEKPDDPEARFLRGVIFVQTGDSDRALAIFRSLTEQFPNLPEPYNNLAVLQASRGEFDKARGLLLKAIELQPGYDTAYENLGDVYAKLAALAYEQAYRISQRNRRSLSKSSILSQMLLHAGDRGEPVKLSIAGAPEPPAPPPQPSTPSPAPQPGAPPPAAAGADTAPRCFLAGPVADAAMGAAMIQWLAAHGASAEAARHTDQEPLYYKVYLPPEADRAASAKRLAELSQAGLKDVAIIGEGDLRNGISLGVFSKQASVHKRLTQIRKLGLEAKVRTVYRDGQGQPLRITVPAGKAVDDSEFSGAFPGYSLAPSPCGQGDPE